MPEQFDTTNYDRVILIDTQVVLETRPLDQLPWAEMSQGPILLLVCRTVQGEIDAKKGDGRLGERSRAFNRLLDRFLETRVPVALNLEAPRVDVALVRNASIDWAALDELDRDEADDRIVHVGARRATAAVSCRWLSCVVAKNIHTPASGQPHRFPAPVNASATN